MEVNVRGRNVNITDRFENYVSSKTDKISVMFGKAQKLEVKVSKLSDKNPNLGDKVELTIVGIGPIIRAESEAGDKYSAFDIALGRLFERLRRVKSRKTDHKGRHRVPLIEAVLDDFSSQAIQPAEADLFTNEINIVDNIDTQDEENYSPIMIRKKEFPAERLSASEAVDQMELLGHDFYLFVDASNDRASVVYRRKGWDYGVITLIDAK